MRFLKEILIIIFIVLFVFGAEFITVKITKNAISEILEGIGKLEGNLDSSDTLIEMEKLENKWKEKENVLSYFTEKKKKKKVSDDIVIIKSNIENSEYENASEKIAEVKFRMEHIKNKQRLCWNNIF